MVKIIGVDPGLASTGVGVVSGSGLTVSGFSYGGIYTAKELPLPERLETIYTKLHDVLATEKPDAMVVEDIFSLGKYPKSGILLGKVIGVILLAGRKTGVPAMELPVREAKRILTGNGNARKEQLERSVRRLLKLETPIHPFHASDALALALIGLYRYPAIPGLIGGGFPS